MDSIILLGGVLFGIGFVLGALNTKWRWSFWKYPYVSRSKKVSFISFLFIVIGLLIVVFRAIGQGYVG